MANLANSPEIFVPISGYEQFYLIGNQGTVKSLDRWVLRKGCKTPSLYKGKILAAATVLGYRTVGLCKDSTMKCFKVHRLVAIAFLSNPENKDQVNHINGIKSDNRVENLEWATAKENVNHSYFTGLKHGRKLGKHHMAKRIIDTSTGTAFDTIKEAAQHEGVGWCTLSSFLNKSHNFFSDKMRRRLSKFIIY